MLKNYKIHQEDKNILEELTNTLLTSMEYFELAVYDDRLDLSNVSDSLETIDECCNCLFEYFRRIKKDYS